MPLDVPLLIFSAPAIAATLALPMPDLVSAFLLLLSFSSVLVCLHLPVRRCLRHPIDLPTPVLRQPSLPSESPTTTLFSLKHGKII
ncbi:hypothetical protein FF1_005210 [Malus domestica]